MSLAAPRFNGATPAARVHHQTACSAQWASRPASERFWTVRELWEHTRGIFTNSRELKTRNDALAVSCIDPVSSGNEELLLITESHSAVLNHWSFGQLCSRLRAPAAYLRTLPPEKVRTVLEYELGRHKDGESMLWLHEGVVPTALAVTSERYARIASYLVCEALLDLPSEWKVPPARPSVPDSRSRPATAEDVLSGNRIGLSIREGELIAPAGVYGDDRSMFVFMVNEERPVQVSAAETLYRGFYVRNSEVGDSALVVTVFDYLAVCGNHIIWGCRNVQEYRIRHLGEKETLREKFQLAFKTVREFADTDTSLELAIYAEARKRKLGDSMEETVTFVTEKELVSKRLATEAWTLADKYSEIHGSPNTAWGMANGITRLSQASPYADVRDALDRGAAKLLALGV